MWRLHFRLLWIVTPSSLSAFTWGTAVSLTETSEGRGLREAVTSMEEHFEALIIMWSLSAEAETPSMASCVLYLGWIWAMRYSYISQSQTQIQRLGRIQHSVWPAWSHHDPPRPHQVGPSAAGLVASRAGHQVQTPVSGLSLSQ